MKKNTRDGAVFHFLGVTCATFSMIVEAAAPHEGRLSLGAHLLLTTVAKHNRPGLASYADHRANARPVGQQLGSTPCRSGPSGLGSPDVWWLQVTAAAALDRR